MTVALEPAAMRLNCSCVPLNCLKGRPAPVPTFAAETTGKLAETSNVLVPLLPAKLREVSVDSNVRVLVGVVAVGEVPEVP